MSEAEDHARLSASTVPGHRSSSTLGLNGAQPGDDRPSNVSREVGDGQHDESPTPREVRSDQRGSTNPTSEVRHEQRGSSRIESPPGDEENPNGEDSPGDDEQNPEDECIKYMDDVVETFRRKETMKLKALSQIISILNFNPSRTEQAKDAAVEYYARTLNEIEALASSAAKRGEHAIDRLHSHSNRDDIQRSSRNIGTDNAINELISQISRDSNQPPK